MKKIFLNTLVNLAFSLFKVVRFIRYNTRVYSYPKNAYQKFCEEKMESSYQNFKIYFNSSLIMKAKYIKQWAIKLAIDNNKSLDNLFLEFGVHLGQSINPLSKILSTYMVKEGDQIKTIYGFDGFVGLKENWVGTSGAPHLDVGGEMPKVNTNVVLIKGWIQDTLKPFLNDHKQKKIVFVNIDVDTYETTKFILQEIKHFLIPGSIIIFDELYNFPGWEVGEYKALKEIFDDKTFKYIAFSEDSKQVVIEII